MTKKEIKNNIKVLEENGVVVSSQDETSIELEAYTPAGGDMIIVLDEPSREKLQEYIDNFDINEEVLLWWQGGRNNDLPFDNLRDHYNDYEKYLEKMQEICDKLE